MAPSASSSTAKPKKTKSKTSDGSKKKRSTVEARNEGAPDSWAYEPPENSSLAEYGVDFGEFDYDAVKEDEEAELWLVRVPASVKLKHLEKVRLSAPVSRPGIIGSIERKDTTYNAWSYNRDDLGKAEHGSLPGEELSNLSVLLPRSKKGGKLYQTPKPVTRHLVLTAPPARPTFRDANESEPPSALFVEQNPARFAYPEDLLTHHFKPYGSETAPAAATDRSTVMEIDPPHAPESPKKKAKKVGSVSEDGVHEGGLNEKGKKRKVEEESPKVHKSKKTKK